MSDFAAHAAAYAAAGLPVFPLQPRAKVPATKHGKDDATADLGEITRWWTRHPNHNIAIRPPAGTVVLDVDRQHGGPTALAELRAQHGRLPKTWTAETGQGGLHIWLRATGPFRGKLCQGVDLKSENGYLVAPPSIHPNGNTYRWLNTELIAHAPYWLLLLLTPPPPKPRRVETFHGSGDSTSLVRCVAQAPQGNRNELLYWAARRAVENGTLDALYDDLTTAAVSTGLPPTAVEGTLKSARKWA